MDLMRLPLGILSGMGFIGAGAILRRDSVVLGVTTAATLWFVTVMGLCFGGGQLGLGVAACALGFIVLRLLKPLEDNWKQDHQATLTVTATNEGPSAMLITQAAEAAGYKIKSSSLLIEKSKGFREIKCQITWRGKVAEFHPPSFVEDLGQRPGTLKVSWDN
jgi:putative Mg2+ transporter-C (MgtC) family protein